MGRGQTAASAKSKRPSPWGLRRIGRHHGRRVGRSSLGGPHASSPRELGLGLGPGKRRGGARRGAARDVSRLRSRSRFAVTQAQPGDGEGEVRLIAPARRMISSS